MLWPHNILTPHIDFNPNSISYNLTPDNIYTMAVPQLINRHLYMTAMNNAQKLNLIECAKMYWNNGKKLMLLGVNTKVPPNASKREDNFFQSFDAVTAAINKGHNIAWVMGAGDFVIDVDVGTDKKTGQPKQGDASFKKLIKLADASVDTSVLTPSGGRHYYLTIDENDKYGTTDKQHFKDIDFLQMGRYVLISGCMVNGVQYSWHDDNIFCGPQQPEAPASLLAVLQFKGKRDKDKSISKGAASFEVDGADYNEISASDIRAHQAGYTEAKLISELEHFNPDCDNDRWLTLAMGVKDVYADERGYKIFDRWCQGAYWKGGTPPPSSYSAQENWSRWESITPKHVSGQGTGIGTLKMMVKEHQDADVMTEAERMVTAVKASTSLERLNEHIRDLRGRVDIFKHPIASGTLETAFKEQFISLGHKVALPKVRELIWSSAKASSTNVVTEFEPTPKPEALVPFVEDLRASNFHNMDTGRVYGTIGQLSRALSSVVYERGTDSLAAYLDNTGHMAQVDGVEYRPDLSSKLFEYRNDVFLNSFDKNTVPLAKDNTRWTPDDKAAVDRVAKHILNVCNGNEKHTHYLTAFMAHQVQALGVKVQWAPLIVGGYGFGKTTIGVLMAEVLGHRNVRTVKPSSLGERFNSWAEGAALAILEELRITGVSTRETYENLKSPISDGHIDIERKGIDAYNVKNVTNYIAFSNMYDALAIPEGDRRWYVIHSNLNNERFEELTGEPKGVYFDALYDAINCHGPALRQWLLDYDLTDLKAMREAPHTEAKESMIARSYQKVDGLIEAIDLLKGEPVAYGWSKSYIVSKALGDALTHEHGIQLKTRSMSTVADQLGYTRGQRFTVHKVGQSHVYFKNTLTTSEIEDIKAELKAEPDTPDDQTGDPFSDVYDL